jgi:hypothetical protein
MKPRSTLLLSLVSSLAFSSLGCSSNVDLADQRQHEVPGTGGGTSEGGSSASNGGATSVGGATDTGGAPTADSGTSTPVVDPSFCSDANCKTYDLRSSGDPVFGTALPPGDESTDCYGFHLNEATYTHVSAIAPLIVNEVELHDMKFYQASDSQVGAIPVVCNDPVNGTLVYTWEPGAGASPESFELPPGDLILQVHCINTSDHVQRDSSGVRLCACTP